MSYLLPVQRGIGLDDDALMCHLLDEFFDESRLPTHANVVPGLTNQPQANKVILNPTCLRFYYAMQRTASKRVRRMVK